MGSTHGRSLGNVRIKPSNAGRTFPSRSNRPSAPFRQICNGGVGMASGYHQIEPQSMMLCGSAPMAATRSFKNCF